MKASEIFSKTAKGQSEIDAKSDALSMKERRVLILVNGDNNAGRLKQLSLCENIEEILNNLLSQGFIEAPAAASSEPEVETDATVPNSEAEGGAREFMCNTLLTFANRVRVAKLIDEINGVDEVDKLKELIKPWYQAISETPGGMYQADDLRKEVQQMILDEEIGGLR